MITENEENKEVIELKVKDKPFWLFTYNYLLGFKRYYSTRERLLKDLKSIITMSKPEYRTGLKREANYEKAQNLKNIKNSAYTPSYRHQKKLEEWKDFSKDELEISIRILDLTGVNKVMRKEIFQDSVGTKRCLW